MSLPYKNTLTLRLGVVVDTAGSIGLVGYFDITSVFLYGSSSSTMVTRPCLNSNTIILG